jgi:hypothetical protein
MVLSQRTGAHHEDCCNMYILVGFFSHVNVF